MHDRVLRYLSAIDRIASPGGASTRQLDVAVREVVFTSETHPIRKRRPNAQVDVRLDQWRGPVDFWEHASESMPDGIEVAGVDLDRLIAHDLLDPSEPQLRLGWPFVPRASGRRVVPLMSLPVIATADGKRRYRLEAVGEVEVVGVEPGSVLEADAQELFWRFLGVSRRAPYTTVQHLPGAMRLIRSLAEGAGLAAVRESEHGPGVYALPGRTGPSPRPSLSWLSESELSGTAWAHLFEPRADAGTTGVIEVPFPLNAGQRSIVLASRTSDIVTVSGPPGTGKTHVAAAVAMDAVARGRTVLMVSASQAAAEATAEILDRHAAPTHVRFGRPGDRRRVARYLEELTDRGPAVAHAEAALREARGVYDEARAEIERRLRTEQQFELDLAARGVGESPAEEARTTSGGDWWGRWRLRRSLRRAGLGVEEVDRIVSQARDRAERDLRIEAVLSTGGIALGPDFERLRQARANLNRAIAEHIEARNRDASLWDRRAVASLRAALTSGPKVRREKLGALSRQFLDVVPMWVGTLGEMEHLLPARPGLFDLVIFDEASHVDLIRAAPALARASRAVVIGDPKQLRHVSFVADADMERAAVEAGLVPWEQQLVDVRRMSLYDVAATASAPHFLDEHFRSHPHLIDFSNREFYDERLRLMTRTPHTQRSDCIEVVQVTPDTEIPRAMELLDAASTEDGTVGVVSPFREHADALEEAVLGEMSAADIERMALVVGTVHSLQGCERDHIVIALGLGERGRQALRFVDDPHLFNVMVTRARRKVTVLLAVDRTDVGGGLLGRYLEHEKVSDPVAVRDVGGSPRVETIASYVREYGVDVATGYRVGAWDVDLVAWNSSRAVACDLEVHREGPGRHLDRRLALLDAGWEVLDAFTSRHLADDEEVARMIATRLA